jgi:LEA14-like dessication related protein
MRSHRRDEKTTEGDAMKPFFRAVLSALAVVVMAMTAGCAHSPLRDPVKINLVGIEQLPGQGLELRLAVKLRVQNPNDAPINFDGISLDLDVRGAGFASGVSDARGTVPRFGEAVLVVPVTVSAMSIVRQAINFASGDRSNVSYAMRGKLGGSIFGGERFESSGQVDIPAALLGNPSTTPAPR